MHESLYNAILDSLPYAILVVDQHLRVVTSNQGCQMLLSKSEQDIHNIPLAELVPHNSLQQQVMTVLHHDVGTKIVELHLDLEEETHGVLRATVTALHQKTVSTPLCLVVLEDISERISLEEQLVQSEKLAGMGLVAQSVAHELGNPLSILSSTLQYIYETLSKAGNEQFADAFETMMDSINQMHAQLVYLSAFPGQQQRQLEFVNLNETLSRMLSFIAQETKKRHIKVVRILCPELPCCQLDSQGIKQVLLNLFKNAIQVMPEGGELRVRTSLAQSDAPDDETIIRIEVADTGIGIRDSDMHFIFRPFYSTKPDGTGLGLALCRRIVEEHGGEITVNSQEGAGSTFIITLPLTQKM